MADGYVVADGVRMPVMDVILAGGCIVFLVALEGPLAAREGPGIVTIFGADGRGVCQATTQLAHPEVPAGEMLVLTMNLKMDHAWGDAERSPAR